MSTVIAISQSGETADTLAAMKKANEAGALTVGIVNAVCSSIARGTDLGHALGFKSNSLKDKALHLRWRRARHSC